MRSVLVGNTEGGFFLLFDVRYSSSRPMSRLCVSHYLAHYYSREHLREELTCKPPSGWSRRERQVETNKGKWGVLEPCALHSATGNSLRIPVTFTMPSSYDQFTTCFPTSETSGSRHVCPTSFAYFGKGF